MLVTQADITESIVGYLDDGEKVTASINNQTTHLSNLDVLMNEATIGSEVRITTGDWEQASGFYENYYRKHDDGIWNHFA